MNFATKLFLFLFVFISISSKAQDTSSSPLNTVIVTANKLIEKRIEAPIAISVLNKSSINETKASRIDFLLNKISGVYMPSIGNEQHMMAIRQPISLKGLYLYLEDGMPIRTSGLFSSNALIEINTSNIEQIEVIKGPASALYGAEAIGGVVNIITTSVHDSSAIQLNSQLNSIGLKKVDLLIAKPFAKNSWNMNLSYGAQQNGPIDYSDFSKKALSIKHEFKTNSKLSGYQTIQYINYFAQMTGSVDSIHFVQHNLSSMQSFTYRKINALRARQNLVYKWNEHASSILNFMYRDNTMDQNPTYSIASTNNPTKFKGQDNSNYFNSFVLDLQQIMRLSSIKSKLIVGGIIDITNQNLVAHYIDIFKDTALGKYTKFTYPIKDSLVTSYQTKIYNQAAYLNVITNMSNNVKTNIALRYDHFEYQFQNKLNSGTPSSNNNFTQFTPKIGLTYNKPNWGGYINYSEGFVPPQITEIYNAIRIPFLLPQSFKNTEIGGWYQRGKWYAQLSLYQLLGMNEIISVRQTDGVNLNQNSGSTKHVGIEYQLKYKFSKSLELNWNATNAQHNYISTIIKGVDVSGNEMTAAPHFWSNLSANLKANKHLYTLFEWQHQSSYFMDETNATKYPGFDLVNIRFNYTFKKSELWLHFLNVTNTYYSTMATKNFSLKGNAAYSYYIGEPRSIALGWKWIIR